MRAVVDTNVAVTANGHSVQASLECIRACVARLIQLRERGKIILDASWLVIGEYKDNLSQSGQPGVGDAFLLWVLQNWKNPTASEVHYLDCDPLNPEDFPAFPKDPALVTFDQKDRKFAALAAISGAPVWDAVDPDWWEYRDVFQRHDIRIDFLCPDFLASEE
jgi:hypothetical protein